MGKYVKKGQLLYIEGKLKTRTWDDKEGNKRYSTEIIVDGFNSKIEMLGSKQSQESAPPIDDLPY